MTSLNWSDLSGMEFMFVLHMITLFTFLNLNLRRLLEFTDFFSLGSIYFRWAVLLKQLSESLQASSYHKISSLVMLHHMHQPHQKLLLPWVVETLGKAGINSKTFKAHATCFVSTSAAYNKGLSLSEIGKAAGWSNFTIFAKFYNQPVEVNNFGFRTLNGTLQISICVTLRYIFYFETLYAIRCVIMYSSFNINQVLHIFQRLSGIIAYTCALKSCIKIFWGSRSRLREETFSISN